MTEPVPANLKSGNEAELFREYLDIADVIIVVIGIDGRVTYINKKGCDILGYHQKGIIGKDWFDTFIPKTSRPKVKEGFNEMVVGKLQSMEHFVNHVLTRSGDERLIAWHNALLKDKSGKIISTLSSGQDITERRAAEEELQKALEKLQIDLGHSVEPIDINNVLSRSSITLWRIPALDYTTRLMRLTKSVALDYHNILFVSLTRPCSTIMRDFEREGINSDKFTLICLDPNGSWRAKMPASFGVIDTIDVTGLSIRVKEALENTRPQVMIFDSFNTMFAYLDSRLVTRFAQDLMLKLTALNCKGVLPVVLDNKEKAVINSLGLFVDETVDMP